MDGSNECMQERIHQIQIQIMWEGHWKIIAKINLEEILDAQDLKIVIV